MAIAIRNTATLNDEFDYVSDKDEALDKGHPDYRGMWERFNEGHVDQIPLKDGEEPTVFRLRPIADSRLQARLDHLKAEDDHHTWMLELAAYSLISASNFEVEIERRRVRGFERVTDKTLNEIKKVYGDNEVLYELGLAVHYRANPSQD